MKKILVPVVLIVLSVVVAISCTKKDGSKGAVTGGMEPLLQSALDAGMLPIPYELKVMEGNPSSPEKIELGKLLYFDPRLSKSQLLSCNTCHNVGFGGDDYQETSLGHGWAKGPRNSPTVFNSVYNTSQFWDGRAADLKEQAKGPIQASVEMAATPEYVVEVLKSIPEYVEEFKLAFPGEADPVTFDNVAATIALFEATLTTPNAPIDKYLRGDLAALNSDQKAGLAVYIDQGCVSCHTGVNLGGDGYFEFGVFESPDADVVAGDKGRFALTQAEGDEFAFKAPTLRNIEYTAPYFHTGKVWSLAEATQLMSSSQLGIELSEENVNQLLSLMDAFTGEQPQIMYPTLPPSTDNTPKPVWK